MKLKDFIKQLKDIEKKNGNSMQVKMADDIPVVEPKIILNEQKRKCVIITDQK
jgi:chitinase